MGSAEPRRERVAELIVTRSSGGRRGSGYLVAPGVVLTAAHVVADATEVTVRFEADLAGERTVRALRWETVGGADLALVVIPPVADDAEPPHFGQIGPSAVVVPVQAVGFPRWKLRDDLRGGRFRDSHQAFGGVAPLSNWRGHTMEITVGPPPSDPTPDVSPWEGMSGAAVWADGRIVGVVRAHHAGDGLSRLDATPLGDALDTLDPQALAVARTLLPTLPAPADLTDVTRRPQDRPEDADAPLRDYLDLVTDRFRMLTLQGVDEDGSLRIELDKVYVALKAEPVDDYVLGNRATLHAIEVREAAGVADLAALPPARLAELDSEVVRRTYRPRREQARRDKVTEMTTIAEAFRLHRRMVILGGPGSGKSTLGRWLALQLARGTLDQLSRQVPAVGPPPPGARRIHVNADTRYSFSRAQFDPFDRPDAAVVDAVPARGTLALSGTPVAVGQAVPLDQVDRLTYAPESGECGIGYAQARFSTGVDATPRPFVFVFDVVPHVRVPVSQVDPDELSSEDLDRLIDLGPARVPVFLRLAHYAHETARRKDAHEPWLPLIKYLGRDPDLPDDDAVARNALLVSLLRDRRAVVILDGLDELPEGSRQAVTSEVVDFIDDVRGLNAAVDDEEPWRSGGNQVIVTSRHVGYNSMGLQAGCAHLGIQPMRRPAVEHFVRMWTSAVTAKLPADAPARPVADALISEIYDDFRPTIRDLADTPLLVTILATVYWADGRLPDQRAGVYDRVVENLLRIWLKRPECVAHQLTREELLAALEPLAAALQDSAVDNGLISLDRIGEVIEEPLAGMRGTSPDDRVFKPVLRALLTAIRKHVGLLAEEASGSYAFSHRTFQEFLAARHILAGKDAARTIVERLDDPHWREPLLLALGLAMTSTEWGGPKARARLLSGVLAGDDHDPLIPRAALLLVDALPDLTGAPDSAVGQVVRQLLKSYAFGQDQPQAEGLREAISAAFTRLRAGPRAEAAIAAIAEAIRQPADDLAGAAAAVLVRVGWFTTETVDTLLEQVHRDHGGPQQPIRWALVAALAQPVGGASWEKQAPDLAMPRLLVKHLPMRRLIEPDPELTAFVRADVDWLWLMVALYGGVGRGDLRKLVRAHQLRRLGEVRLAAAGSVGAAAGPPPALPPVEFSPGDIAYDLADPELSRTVRQHLSARRPARELVAAFLAVWERGRNPVACADAVVGLAALGEDVVPLVSAALADPDRRAAAHGAVGRFRWLRSLVREPLLRSSDSAARTIPEDIPEDHQLDLLRLAIEARTAGGGGPLMVSDRIAAYRYVDATSEPVRAAVEAEYWAHAFSGLASDEAGFEVDLRSPEHVLRGWSAVPEARNHRASQRLPWSQAVLAPRRATPVEHYLAMLDGILEAPAEVDAAAGVLLGRCGPVVDAHPELLWETLAVCCLRGKEFRTGFLSGVAGAGPSCPPLARDAAFSWATRVAGTGPTDVQQLLSGVFRLRHENKDDPETDDPRADAVSAAMLHAARITDPYLRFRALWRLLGAVRHQDPAIVDLAVLDSYLRISDPQDRVRAFEVIVTTVHDDRRDGGAGDVLDIERLAAKAAEISDAGDRARALARLALFSPERSEDLLGAAVLAIGRIDGQRQRAEAIDATRAVVGELSGHGAALDAVAGAFADPWLRDRVHGRASRLIGAHRDRFGIGALAWRLPPEAPALGARVHRHAGPTGRLAWGLLYLDAVAGEVSRVDTDRTGGVVHWDQLLGPDWQAGVDGLVESAVEDGLRVTTREASILGRVVESGRAEILDPLWAYLECSDSAALVMVARWSGGTAAVDRWSALVQAEAGRLTSEIIDRLIDLSAHATDRLWLRTALALHGRTPEARSRNRRWSVQRVGAHAVEALVAQSRRVDLPLSARTSLAWARNDIQHDDVSAVDRWLSEADGVESAGWVLESIESADSEVVSRLVEALPSASPAVQRSLLVGLARLAYATTTLTTVQDAVRTAIAEVPPDIRRETSVVPEGAVAYLKVAEQAVSEHGGAAALDAAREMIAASGVWLDEESLSDSGACRKRLSEIGRGRYIALSGHTAYWAEADAMAASLRHGDAVLRLLIAWGEATGLGEEAADPNGHLLSATNAVAQQAPDGFAAHTDPDVWEAILAEWAETAPHWNTRLAAVRLLGLLRRVTARTAGTLRAAMNDVSFVQNAAYASAAEFRTMKDDLLPDLLDLLDDPSASVAASTARLLVGLANAEGATANRRRILLGLRQATAKSTRARPVYLMRDLDEAPEMSIQLIDRLDRLLYRAILEIRGL